MKYLHLLLAVSFILLVTMPTGYNIYSPEMVMQSGKLVMYYGGWASTTDIPNDKIYRAECISYLSCQNGSVVISPTYPLIQINDPTLIQMNGYWIMYMTGNTSPSGELSGQGIYYSTSWEGRNWSPPNLLLSNYWLPSVTKYGNNVIMFANSTIDGSLHKINLGASGVGYLEDLVIPNLFLNVDVVYHPEISLWQMVGETFDSKEIHYLYSYDGTSFLDYGTIISSPNGSVRTPSMHPSTAYYVYYGCSPLSNGMSNSICFIDWSE